MKKLRKIILSLFFLLFGLPFTAHGQQCTLDLIDDDKDYKFSMYLVEYPPSSIFIHLAEGLRSEITFSIHIYEKRKGLFRFFSNRLLYQKNYKQEAKWDIFTREYTLEKLDGTIQTFAKKDDFISAFFSIKNIPLNFSSPHGGDYYVFGRITLETVKFVPPLNMLSSVIPSILIRTGWSSRNFSIDKGSP